MPLCHKILIGARTNAQGVLPWILDAMEISIPYPVVSGLRYAYRCCFNITSPNAYRI